MLEYEEYDYVVIKQIAGNELNPNAVTKALQMAGKPIDKLMAYTANSNNKYIKKAMNSIDLTIEDALKKTIKLANKLTRDEVIFKEYRKKFAIHLTEIKGIRSLNLRQMDQVADSFSLSNALIAATEGAVMGAATTLAEVVPFAQLVIPSLIAADVSASMTFLSRHMCQVAASYGYSSNEMENIPHVLSAMVPTSSSLDEGFLLVKAAAIHEIRAGARFAASHTGKLTNEVVVPQLIHLVRYITQRLGVMITEKELGLLVPVAGAILNGGLNAAFQQANHTSGKDYFRRLHLQHKYGEYEVNQAIDREKARIANKEITIVA